MHGELFASFILIDVWMHLCMCVRMDAIHVHMGAHVCVRWSKNSLGCSSLGTHSLFFVRGLTDLERTRRPRLSG